MVVAVLRDVVEHQLVPVGVVGPEDRDRVEELLQLLDRAALLHHRQLAPDVEVDRRLDVGVVTVGVDERLADERGMERLEVEVRHPAVGRAGEVPLVVERDADVEVVHVRPHLDVAVVDAPVLEEIEQEGVGGRARLVPLVEDEERVALVAGPHGLRELAPLLLDAAPGSLVGQEVEDEVLLPAAGAHLLEEGVHAQDVPEHLQEPGLARPGRPEREEAAERVGHQRGQDASGPVARADVPGVVEGLVQGVDGEGLDGVVRRRRRGGVRHRVRRDGSKERQRHDGTAPLRPVGRAGKERYPLAPAVGAGASASGSSMPSTSALNVQRRAAASRSRAASDGRTGCCPLK